MKIVLPFLLTISFLIQNPSFSQTRNDIQPDILPMKERAEIMDQWTEYRLDNLVPELMRREGIDMWVLIAREYNEDPVLLTMLPATWQSSRRTTILVFFDDGEAVERLATAFFARRSACLVASPIIASAFSGFASFSSFSASVFLNGSATLIPIAFLPYGSFRTSSISVI